jgi:uncharacterized protein
LETKVKYLVDTNVWLERLLDQEKSEIVSNFFDLIPTDSLFVSDFSIHSIGVILSRLKKYGIFEKFINDLFINGQIELLSIESFDLIEVIGNIKKYNLDFDDSYQLSVAQKYDLTIITFDKDFNCVGIIKKSPDDIVSTDFVSLYFLTSANIQKQGDWKYLRYNWTVNIDSYNNIQKIIEK